MGNGNVADIYELSPLQQGMLFHSMHDGATDMYLSQHTYAVDGPLDVDALVHGWQATLAAHPVLRSSFHWHGLDKPLQVVHQEVSLPVGHHDWSGLDEAAQRDRLAELQRADRAAGFDPVTAPLLRLQVIRLGAHHHKLIWTYHHLLLDGWSIPVLLDGVMAAYRALVTGAPPPPPVPAYRDYIAWLQRQDLAQARDFWTSALAGARPSLVARSRPGQAPGGTGAVERRIVALPEALGAGLREAAARHQVTFSTMVQAVWAIVLQSYTGRPEITFGCATSGRPAELPQVERMVGLFANTLPQRIAVPDDGDLGAWLREIQSGYAAMRRYEYTPLADIKSWAGVPGQLLFDSLLVLENYSLAIDAGITDTAGAQALSFRVDTLYDKIDLPLTLTVAPHPVSEMQLLIHRDRFEAGFVDDILTRLESTLTAIVAAGRIAAVVAAAGPRALPAAEPDPALRDRTGTPVPPATDTEAAIAAAYQEILGLPEIDVTASFFELGGDSFAAVRAVGRIEGASIALLAAHPSVRELAQALAPVQPGSGLDAEIAELEQLLASKRAARAQQADQVVPTARESALPCTDQQEYLWHVHQADPTSPAYHIPFVLRLHGALDVAALERAVQALVARHEALRTRFQLVDGIPHQVIDAAPAPPALPVVDLEPGEVERWGPQEAHRPFDLTTGPLFRVSLGREAPDRHVIVLVVHHIVADGWSLRVLADELAQLYTADGGQVQLPPLRLQAADHAAWQRRRLAGTELRRQLDYWRQTLAGLPTIDFPTDRPRPARPTTAGTPLARRIPDELTTAARAYARAHQGSLLAVVQAAVLTVLHRYTGQEDLPIGSTFSGRVRPELEVMVGYLANNLVLRTSLAGRPSFADLVVRCHATVRAAADHQEVPFGLVVDALAPPLVPGRNPLFQLSLTLQPAENRAGLRLGTVAAEPIRIAGGHSRFDIAIDIFDSPDRIDLKIEYSTELFDAHRIERLLDHILAALAAGLAEPSTPVEALDIAPAGNRLPLGPTRPHPPTDESADPPERRNDLAGASTGPGGTDAGRHS